MTRVIVLEVDIYRDKLHAQKLLIIFINKLSETLRMLWVYDKASLFITIITTRKKKFSGFSIEGIINGGGTREI